MLRTIRVLVRFVNRVLLPTLTMQIKNQKDFGYIIDALHFLKEPRRPLWLRRVDRILAAVVYYGYIVLIWYLAIRAILWLYG